MVYSLKDTSPKKAGTYLKTDSRELLSIFAKIKELEALNKKVSAYLDPNLVKYCQVANIIGGRLIIIVANGSIATQLRFQMVDLIRKFKQDSALQKIHDIQCKVHPLFAATATRPSNKNARKMLPLSLETAEIIHHMATSLDDPKLKDIMLRIAQHTKDRTKDNDNG